MESTNHRWAKWRLKDELSNLYQCDLCQEFKVIDTTEVEWLSVKQACKQIGVTTRTLYGFIDRGELTAYKFGRVIRLQQVDITRFLREARIRPGELDHLYPDRKIG